MTAELALSLVQLLVVVLAAYTFYKKFPLEKKSASAEANSDNATAEKTTAEAAGLWLNNYNKMFSLVQQRDTEIINLGTRMGSLTQRDNQRDQELYDMSEKISNLEKRHESQLEAERKLRIKAEHERDELKKEVHELRQIVDGLKEQLAQVAFQLSIKGTT